MPDSSRRQHDAKSAARPRYPVLALQLVAGDLPQTWLKTYRTEIAACASSVLSTCTAVCYDRVSVDGVGGILASIPPLTLSSHQYPLDSVKTRMQAWVPFSSHLLDFDLPG